jgi:hypothetical protein
MIERGLYGHRSKIWLPMSEMGQNAKNSHPIADIARCDWHGREVPILLQKDFCASGEQHSLKVRRACATLIQKSIRPGVTEFV